MNTHAEIISALKNSTRVLLICHYNPDGDALGSSGALGHALIQMGKEVRMYNHSHLPEHYEWLPLPAPLSNDLAELRSFDPDLLVAMDCGDARRTGPDLAPLLEDKKLLPWGNSTVINIDHHLGNPKFGDLNLVDPGYAATAHIVGELIEEMGLPLSGDIGICIYLGIFSDSGGFSYPNTSAELLEMAARIVRAGFNVGSFIETYRNNWSVNRMRLWGKLWSELEVFADGQVVISAVSREHLESTHTSSDDLDSYASFLRRLKGTKAVLMIRENKDGTCKASFRSDGVINVQRIAAALGGGGHKAAAGVESTLGLHEFIEKAKALIALQITDDSNIKK